MSKHGGEFTPEQVEQHAALLMVAVLVVGTALVIGGAHRLPIVTPIATSAMSSTCYNGT